MREVGEAVRLIPDEPLANGDCIPVCMRTCLPTECLGRVFGGKSLSFRHVHLCRVCTQSHVKALHGLQF